MLRMENGGWDASAEAWIASMGDDGDWSRRHVLDPCILGLFDDLPRGTVLDAGCGEGRFCRKLGGLGFQTTGIDPTARFIELARDLDPDGKYDLGTAEAMPYADAEFDYVLANMSLLDIPDYRAAIHEMTRVLKPGGRMIVANIGNQASSSADGWVRDADGNRLYYPVDNYLDEIAMEVGWRGIQIINYHRPLSAYMGAFLGQSLILEHYLEPEPIGVTEEEMRTYRRVPWFTVMVWRKP